MITRSKPIGATPQENTTSTRAEIPDGIHTANILTANFSNTLNGIAFIDLKLEIVGHENDKRVYTKIWLSDGKGNDDRNYDALLSCGYVPDTAGALPDPAPELFAHRTCKVRIGTNKRGYKDVTYWIAPKVEKTAPAPAPAPAPRDYVVSERPQAITHDLLAGHASASNGSRPAFTRPTRSAPPQTVDLDDIPF